MKSQIFRNWIFLLYRYLGLAIGFVIVLVLTFSYAIGNPLIADLLDKSGKCVHIPIVAMN
jgi:hypothetical protein